jgi:hypothetical protein
MKKKREDVFKSARVDDSNVLWIERDGSSNRFLVFYGNFLTWLGSKLIGLGEPYATYYEMIIDDEEENK